MNIHLCDVFAMSYTSDFIKSGEKNQSTSRTPSFQFLILEERTTESRAYI